MKKSIGLLIILMLALSVINSCGGGGGGAAPGPTPEAGTTTVSGSVRLSSTLGKPSFKVMQALTGGTPLTDATVELYNADKPEWLYPVAITLTDSSGAYMLSKLSHAHDNGDAYSDNSNIPTGNYTIIAYKVILGAGTYIAVQQYVKKFDGPVVGNDLIAQDSGTQPAVLSMFGLPKNNDGTYGSDTTLVPRNAAIQVTFNTAMARLFLLSAISIKDASNADVLGLWKVSADLLTATFYPTNSLALNMVYTVKVGTGAKNLYGTSIAAIVTGKFKTKLEDSTPPNGTAYQPTLQEDVPITTPIQIATNEPLDVNTFTITSTPSIGDKPTVLFAGKGSNSPGYPYVYEIVPAGVLQLNTNYAITVSGAKDLVGLTLTTFTFNFKTEAVHAAPVVVTSSPSGTDAGINDVVSATFSATMDPQTINATTFTVDGVTGIVNSNGTTANFIPSQPLNYNTTYTATVTTSAQDLAGSALANNFTWTFTTAAAPPPPDTAPPTTTASPAGGLYNTAKSVTLTASEAATIYYTTNGDMPATVSPIYSAPINVSASTTLKFFAKDDAGNSEGVKTETYIIDTTPPTVVSSTPAANATDVPRRPSVSVIFSEAVNTTSITASTFTLTDAGNNIISGIVTPSESSAIFTPTADLNLSAVYTVTITTGVKDVAGNSLASDTTWSFTTITVPDTAAPTVTLIGPANNATNVPVNTVLLAIFSEAIDPATIQSPSTAFSVGSASGTVTYDPATTTATYTPASPLAYGTIYNAVISTSVKDLAGNALAGSYSWTFTTADPPDTAAPTTTASPAGGLYNSSKAVTLTANETAVIYFTVDGSTPTTGSASLSTSGTLNIIATTTLKFFAKDAAGNTESVKTESYTIDTVAPITSAAPSGGTFNAAQTVTLTANEAATIYYTLNGTTPTTLSSIYSGPISIAATTTLKYFAKDTAGNSELVNTTSFTIDTVAPTTTASPAGGTYGTAQTVTLTANKVATIYYTLDGTTPTTASNVYSGPISIATTKTLKFFAVDTLGNTEVPKTQTYTIDAVAPTTTASPQGGTYGSAQSVTLTANEQATIYYTIDGTTPTTSSPVYSSSIYIASAKTLKFFAIDVAGNSESVKVETYSIGCSAALTPPAGVSPDAIVSAVYGNDPTATGTCQNPYKTITAALAANGVAGRVVWVAPGTYNAASGEVFPITLPDGVSLIGDEANKGQGTALTKIIGGGALTVGGACGTYGSTIYAGANSVIAGFELTNASAISPAMTLVIRNNNVTLRNNAMVNNTTHTLFVCNGSTNHVISGNIISGNTGVGLAFIGGGVGSKVENNIITKNLYGLEYDSAGGDLGGGPTGSAGGNTIALNTGNDIWTNTATTIYAMNNYWDNTPPTINTVVNGCSGKDICNTSLTATIYTDNPSLAVVNSSCLAALTPPAGVYPNAIVSAVYGNDATATGTCLNPYKTVTAALAVNSAAGRVVWVAPGTYDTTNGEVFPITLPAGVSLIGDEANKGQGTTNTKIIGGGSLTVGGSCGTYGSTIYAGANSMIAGFVLTDANAAITSPMTLVIRNNNITLRNNAIVNNTTHAIYMCNGSTNHVISGNIIKSNSGMGIGFIGGGASSKVENNAITNNGYGLEYDSAGGDLGGGPAGSAGGNTISCNTSSDIWTNTSITITAMNNYWDHNPATVNITTGWSGCSGKDLCNFSLTATINTTGAGVAATPCP